MAPAGLPKVSLPRSPVGWLVMLVASAIGFLAGYVFLATLGRLGR